MAIEIITAHEADQIIATRKPLWPTHNACTGNCQQGRACDCLADIGEEDDTRDPMTRGDALLALTLIFGCWGAVAAVAMAAGWIK